MKKRIFAVLCVLLMALALLIFLNVPERNVTQNYISSSGYKLNTYVTITIYDSDNTDILDACMRLCDEYELIFSRTNPESELYRLNNGLLPISGDGYHTVSEDLYHVIETGKQYANLSHNAFSIALEPLTSIWNFTDDTKTLPNPEEIDAALLLLNSEDILIRAPNQVTFTKEGAGIDLGAIAKGYIADKIKEYLLSEGVQSAVISLGGNVLCIGQKQTGPFSVGIEDPFDPGGEPIAVLRVTDKSVVTSGTYQRSFEKDGVLYHHILDSKTGYPVKNGLTSVSIVTDSSAHADALSTTCFSLGLEKGLELLNETGNADGMFITTDGDIYYTDGFFEKYDVKVQ